MIDIFEYIDYRKFIDNAIKHKKLENPTFSHRFIIQHLGLSSSGYILAVISGKRKLTERLALGLATIFKLKRREANYFLQLVRYNDAKSPTEKQYHFQRLMALRKRQVKRLGSDKFRYYEKWYYPAVRELLSIKTFRGDYKELASRLNPPITPTDARKAIQELLSLGLIEKDNDGAYRKKDAVLSSGDTWDSAIIHHYQRQYAKLGAEALDRFPKAERDISNVTMSVSENTLDLMRQRIAHLRSELLEMARSDTTPDRVVQCNFAVFPLSDKASEDK